MKRALGFTLLELMVVVIIVAILAGFAISAYQKQLRKSRRAEGKQILTELSLAEEKWRSTSVAYNATVTSLVNGTPNLVYYTVALARPAAGGGNCPDGATALTTSNSFSVTATASATGGQNKDTGCTALVLASKCGQVTKTPSTCW
jgi:type IV pilus assembly protein PilE